jgi:hypothetical protein
MRNRFAGIVTFVFIALGSASAQESWCAELSLLRQPADTPPRAASSANGGAVSDFIFAYEDTDDILFTQGLTEASASAVFVPAANALLAAHGDNFDVVGIWLNFNVFAPGCAVFLLGRNDVEGLGLPIFDDLADTGLVGSRLAGLMTMLNVKKCYWQPGAAPDADMTRLVINHELMHRWGVYLPDSGDLQFAAPLGTPMDPFPPGCGSPTHWSYRIDTQGSCQTADWVGTNPATLQVGPPPPCGMPCSPPGLTRINFNTDIPGGVYSYPDLYLMGMVSPGEMDAGAGELRQMDDANCSFNPYTGSITPFTSADIIATAGLRVPDSTASQKDFRIGWVMIHRPGSAPVQADLDKAAGILQQQSLDFAYSTLGRGTTDNTLTVADPFLDMGFGLAGTNGVPVLSASGVPVAGEQVCFDLSGAPSDAAVTFVTGTASIVQAVKGGFLVPVPQYLLNTPVDGSGELTLTGRWPDSIPSGTTCFVQCWIQDPAGPEGLSASNAIKIVSP